LLIAATLLVAATRVLALARSPWEWDEMAFSLGVRNYDVIHHFPHPPGFPLFIAFAKVFRFIGLSDFRALQMVVLLGAIALFPLTYLLARELGFSFGVAFGGALMLAFAPNVWFYGGTAFSDVPTLALTLAACVLLLRGAQWGAGAPPLLPPPPPPLPH
jgi:4-amino-4-deoxy-L-arabinose transferase-like glycosyltransferase